VRRAAILVVGVLGLTAAAAAARVDARPDVATAGTPSASQDRALAGFTDQQASRGQDVYTRACAACHRNDLCGNEDGAPALRGAAFVGRWAGRPLSEFYFVLAETMPQDAPGDLTAREYVDIISFVLQRNGMSAGAKDLPADMPSLATMALTTPRESGTCR
jgi:S-disulfanyl-L-cysteine oxidoreductase SoxD